MDGLKCCGINGYQDFQNKDPSINISPICCGNSVVTCNVNTPLGGSAPGCVEKLFTDLKGYMKYAIIFAAVVILVEILAIALALGLSNNINNDTEDPDYDGIAMGGTTYGGSRVDSMFSS